MLGVIRRSPLTLGYQRSRWSLELIRQSCPWLRVETMAGLSQILTRLGISYKRGREYVHSPDEHYQAKAKLIQAARAQVQAEPARYVFLYLDELTYYRQPSLARAYELVGVSQPRAQRSYQANTAYRVLSALNAASGQVTYRQRSHTDLACLAGFWYDLRLAYPNAELIYVVVDNWPVHFHPDVLAPLQDQHFPFPPKLPANWPSQPSAHARLDNLPIQLLCLPTYASWLNPIEKLWRWLKQDILHLHRLSHDWQQLKELVAQFLDNFAHGSSQLLRYVGLLPI